MAGHQSILFRAPRPANLPHLLTMLNSIGSDEAVARHLGVSLRTVQKYRREGQAPRCVMLSLFWETPWGISVIDCEAQNDARLSYTSALVLRRENEALRGQVSALEALLAEGKGCAANEHFYRVGVR